MHGDVGGVSNSALSAACIMHGSLFQKQYEYTDDDVQEQARAERQHLFYFLHLFYFFSHEA
jgi:hypothetical protein